MPRHEEQPRAIKDLRAYVYECCEAIAKGDATEAIAAILWAVIQDRLSEAVAARDEYARALERIENLLAVDGNGQWKNIGPPSIFDRVGDSHSIARAVLSRVPKPLSDSEEDTD